MRNGESNSTLHRLKPLQVVNAKAGIHADGGHLFLRVQPIKDKDGNVTDRMSASWFFRYTSPLLGKQREMGLGVAHRDNVRVAGDELARMRKRAATYRDLLDHSIDPMQQRREQREANATEEEVKEAELKREQRTLARVARAYHERVIEPQKSAQHAYEWIRSLENHVPEKFWHAPIDTIRAPELLDFFIELLGKVPETARRVVQRLRVIFGDAEFREWCAGNPADAAARRLREADIRQERGSFAALPFADVPAFMAQLRLRDGVTARALEFALLTAARTGEVIGATWSEFHGLDGDDPRWIVPAERMKSSGKRKREPHTVHLSPRAVEILREMKEQGGRYVFAGRGDGDTPLSNMAMLTLLRRMDADKRTTVHGLCRASFSTWANEKGVARPDVIEACLAHSEENRVRVAYNRAQFAEERRALLAKWADYCESKALAANVVEMTRRAK